MASLLWYVRELWKPFGLLAIMVVLLLWAFGPMPTQRSVNRTCQAMLAMARTNAETLIVYSAKPSVNYTTCGDHWVNVKAPDPQAADPKP